MAVRRASKERRVRDVMVADVVTIESSASLVTAAQRMEAANIGMLPVVEAGHVVGVLTDRDIVVRAVAHATRRSRSRPRRRYPAARPARLDESDTQ